MVADRLGLHDDAVCTLREALRRDGRWIAVRFDLALAMLCAGDRSRAFLEYSRGVHQAVNGGVGRLRGVVRVALDDLEESLAERRALATTREAIAARDLFTRDTHAEAVARINFCVAEAALGVITGEVGAGKTVAVRAAVAALDLTRHHIIYVPNPAFGTRGLYVTIVAALGANPRFHKAEVMRQAADLLAAEQAERHRRVVLVVDEAHLLSPEQLEELRLLTNTDMDQASPFAGILVGQPTLARQLRMGVFAALDQRIATRFTLKPMDLAESAAYLRHHLALVGRTDPLFADDAIARLHRVAGGLPRKLNNAATAALIAAAAEGKALVDDACAKRAAAELTRD